MDLRKIGWLCWRFSLFCIASAASNETSSALTCNVTVQPDGLCVYQLSRVPNLSNSVSWCGTSWEQRNRTVIVHTHNGKDPVFDINLVQNLTDWSVTLKHCHPYLRYKMDCETVEEAVCTVNCSAVLDLKDLDPPTTVNATLICFTENLCLSLLALGLCVSSLLVLGVAVFGGWYFWKTGKCTRRESAEMSASYTPAKNQIV
ncbi:uncharacterized protein LOC116059116 isoform X2 [Sander lucioperca]|uniref:uncharacterized protein LOC116059116 isoform X2 n=1 Tax=Sander lucioperca TaxID=283035 RepID=UPI00125D5AD7|nr:uncharacterized protein LOC116059116 isoform X2 [Sander lucioperca]